VTIDAMGCQVEIADKIVAHKADYLLPKGNRWKPTSRTTPHRPAAEFVCKSPPSRRAMAYRDVRLRRLR
jgi:hypothetical protein